MAYFLLILIAGIIAVLLMRIRIRFELGENRRLLFVGLGQSGPEIDFLRNEGAIKLWGVKLKRFEIGKLKKKPPHAKKEITEKTEPRKLRQRSSSNFVKVLRKSFRPLWSYVVGLLKAVAVEEFEARVAGGFARPDLTGIAFSYYQAALAAMPQIVGRVQYIPDWTGASLSGEGKIAAALPLYKFVGRTAQLLWRLPLRDIVKLAIGKKKGESDDQQRGRNSESRSRRAA